MRCGSSRTGGCVVSPGWALLSLRPGERVGGGFFNLVISYSTAPRYASLLVLVRTSSNPNCPCFQVRSVHLNARTSSVYKVLRSRGVEQRNTGLAWIREHCKTPSQECQRGVLYFMDDDNKYDLRLFDEV